MLSTDNKTPPRRDPLRGNSFPLRLEASEGSTQFLIGGLGDRRHYRTYARRDGQAELTDVAVWWQTDTNTSQI